MVWPSPPCYNDDDNNRYQMVKSEVVKEYGAKVTLYKHRKTGAEVMSVSVDDDNKVGR